MKPKDQEAANDYGKIVKKSSRVFPLTWLFPLLALAVAIWFFWKNWESQGSEIEIRFVSAPGIQGGKTPIIFRGVSVGEVTNVTLDKSLHQVIVHARLQKFAEGLARQNTDFWIDQPEISLKGATGITALIQGNSIQAHVRGGAYATHFQGLEKAPLVTTQNPGLIAYLTAPSCWFIDRGTPIYYHGVLVGMVGEKTIGTNGEATLLVGFKQESWKLVTTKTRFWVLPATSLTISPQGAQVNIAGLSALVEGALAMDQFSPGGEEATNYINFPLCPNEITARADSQPFHISFDEGRDIVSEKTRLCYLGQPIGVVERVHPDPSTRSVDAVVRLESEYTNFAKSDTTYTLVSPTITPHGVSALDTIVTGAYIACEPGLKGAPADHFLGSLSSDDEGSNPRDNTQVLRVFLTADRLPALSKGAPVFYRGLRAGSVLSREMNTDGNPQMEILINPAFRKALHSNSRFWRVPATSVSAASGVLNVESQGLASLLEGAIAFDTFTPERGTAVDTAIFTLYDNEHLASATSAPIRISFEDGRGLLAGKTEVRYLGLPVGIVEKAHPMEKGIVEVTVRMQAGYAFLQRTDSKFLIVHPNVSLNGGVKGIETLIGGIYIECILGRADSFANSFQGSADDETLLQENRGFEIRLVSSATSIRPGALVTYRETKVGEVTAKKLSTDGSHVLLTLDIEQRYRHLIRENSSFSDGSHAEVSVGFIKVKIKAPILTSLNGQIFITTPVIAGNPVALGHEFELQHTAPRK